MEKMETFLQKKRNKLESNKLTIVYCIYIGLEYYL